MNNLFSINRTAGLLERDRATLVRALRHVPADGYAKHGQPRWRMETIRNALAIKPQARRETGKFRDRYSLRSTKLDSMRREYDKQIALIRAEQSLDNRREMALKLAPLLEQYQTTYLELGRSLCIVDDDVLSARAELIFQELMDEVAAAAEWPQHGGDFWIRMCGAMRCCDDADEAGS